MIKALELESFKAFGCRTRVEFAPITLIYGQNSAGKSSILNALNLLKQTRMSREQGALLLPRAEGGLVDLGSFHELLYDHDSSRTLVFRLDVDAPQRPSRPPARRDEDETRSTIGLEVGFRRDQNESDIRLSFIEAYTGGTRIPIVRFEPSELAQEQADSLRRFSPMAYRRRDGRRVLGKLRGAICTDITTNAEFWHGEYRRCLAQKADVAAALRALKEDNLGERPHPNQGQLFVDGEPSDDALDRAMAFYESEFSADAYIERRRASSRGSIIALDGFMPIAASPSTDSEFPELFAANATRKYRQLRGLFFDAADIVLEAGHYVEAALEGMFPLGPYRRAPQRLYIFTGTTPPDVGYAGNLLPDLLFRKRALVEETNAWLDRLDVGYHIKILPVGTPSNDLFEVRLADTRRQSQISVALPDVGFGISQILPFVVQSLASQNQTITIEQPEVHVHPGLQADIADLLVAGIQPGKDNQFIVETHSEHLVLRLLRRIRETTTRDLRDGDPGLRPDQLSIIYVERGARGSELRRLRVDEFGEFIDRWPQGFFEERARELF